ncbi:hypothetical protein GH714_011284 [Hevea brasiliensis]|uniref:Aluminum-activated malate transporter n=1 Tax=Hevea brasiliensis TaxID=3981 RepID=A0A6A6MMC6_HEVBR|nr:hypothetical protein GH714_011284 [Hevea brasiliensis]
MAQEKKETTSSGLEWSLNVEDGSSKILVQEAGLATRAWLGLKGLFLKVRKFLEKAYDIGVNDPRKVVHCLKVGMALTIVSLFYYMRPLYEGIGGNAMWAIMTVVVVFENTAGATISKSLNRVFGTCLAGLLAFGVHWLACKSGEKFGPWIVGTSVFLLASAATFSRFIPSVKHLFDYGAMIFILTFSLELYALITSNMDKLANSLDGYVAEYFNPDDSNKNLLAYKCVLNSKASEESMANFARWEPAHGCFSFKHPWKQYTKIGAAMRSCAYCIEALNSCIDSENQAPEFIKKQLSTACLRVSSNSSSIIRVLAETIKAMKRSSKLEFLVEEMNGAVEELQEALKSLSELSNPPACKNTETVSSAAMETIPLMEVMPVVTFTSLLIEISARIKGIVKAVEELAKVAAFKDAAQDKCKENQPNNRLEQQGQTKDEETMKVLQRV